MRKIGAFVTFTALVALISSTSPSAAFRLGPFHIGLPFLGGGYRHHHHRLASRPQAPVDRPEAAAPATGPIYDTTEPVASAAPETPAQDSTQSSGQQNSGPASPLLYPALALPDIYDDVFSPAASIPWPFGYDTIFHTAFAKGSADQDARVCQPTHRGNAVVKRLGSEIRPTVAQRRLLQKLGGALGMASGFLAKACPHDIPAEPIARLQLMQTQIEELTMALDIIRPPLQEFEQSLNRSQQARYAATVSTSAAAGGKNGAENIAPACALAPTTIDSSVDQINQSLQPNDAQHAAMADIKQAFERAAKDIDAHCPTSLPSTPLARLELIEARLDAEWRAVLSIQTALTNLESGLSDDQKTRFNAMDFAAQ